ncbi:MAG: GAF domain-containing protein [Verrucomicrobiota bacterium]
MENNATRTVESHEPHAAILLAGNCDEHKHELAGQLQAAGYQILFPPNVDEAVKAITVADLMILTVESVNDAVLAVLNGIWDSETAWQVPLIVIVDKADATATARCVELGAEDCLVWPINPEWLGARVQAGIQRKQLWDQKIAAHELVLKEKQEAELLVSSLIPLGVRMLCEPNPGKLMETILVESMRLTDCEGGTIYLRTDDDQLKFLLVRNDMMDLNMGGSTGKPITFAPLRLRDDAGKPNHQYVSCYAAITGQTIHVEDAYQTGRFDFSGTRAFDTQTGYHSQSFLTIPLKNQRQQVIGVLQLINAREARTGRIKAFESSFQPTIEAFAVLAAAILETYRTQLR